MKRQTDCLTERKCSLFLQKTQQTLVFCLLLAINSSEQSRPTLTDPAGCKSQNGATLLSLNLTYCYQKTDCAMPGKVRCVSWNIFVCLVLVGVCLHCSDLLASLETSDDNIPISTSLLPRPQAARSV